MKLTASTIIAIDMDMSIVNCHGGINQTFVHSKETSSWVTKIGHITSPRKTLLTDLIKFTHVIGVD